MSSFLDKVNPTVELPQFMVASGGIGENFNPIKTHEDVWTKRMEFISKQHAADGAKVYLAGVKSSSHSSTPMQVSTVLMTASPNGTFV